MNLTGEDNESLGKLIIRNIIHEIEKSIKHLDSKKKLGRSPYETRKCVKKIRSLLCLFREVWGEDRFIEEDFFFRDSFRPLNPLRDAQMLIETFERLQSAFPDTLARGESNAVYGFLVENRKAVRISEDHERRIIELSSVKMQLALDRFKKLKAPNLDRKQIKPNLARTYRHAKESYGVFAQESSISELRNLRKLTRSLWHQLQFFENSLGIRHKKLGKNFQGLTRILGDAHDLYELKKKLNENRGPLGDPIYFRRLFLSIDVEQNKLQNLALKLGAELYVKNSDDFTNES